MLPNLHRQNPHNPCNVELLPILPMPEGDMKHSRSQALRLLTAARDRIAPLRGTSANSPRFQHWNEEALKLIRELFPDGSSFERDYRALSFGLLFDPHHKAGSHMAEDTYQESLDKAESILTDLLTALGAPDATPAGVRLAADPAEAAGPSTTVVVLHGPGESLLHRMTPVITQAECNRIAVPAWPADPDVLRRELGAHPRPRLTLVAVADEDLIPPAQGTTNSPEVPDSVEQAVSAAVDVYGAEAVRVAVQSKISLKPEQFQVPMLRIDPRGQWRAGLSKLLKASSGV